MSEERHERTMQLKTRADVERAIKVLLGLFLDVKPCWELVLRPYHLKRTLQQNRRYHAVCAEIAEQLILEGRRFTPDALKEYFKRLYIGSTEVPMPDGSVAIYGISTTTLSVGEFADYMTRIDAWATENGVIFEETRQLLNDYAAEAKRWREREEKNAVRESGAT